MMMIKMMMMMMMITIIIIIIIMKKVLKVKMIRMKTMIILNLQNRLHNLWFSFDQTNLKVVFQIKKLKKVICLS
jgi:hypothetical protein